VAKHSPVPKKTVPDTAGRPACGGRLTREALLAQVTELAQPLCDAQGLELVHVEFQRESGGRTLRLYLDKPGGIRLDDCVHVNRQLSDLLDVYLETEEPYHLEVSSPGPRRPLAKSQDFQRFQGRQVKVRLKEPRDGQKNFTGTLLGVEKGCIRLALADGTAALPLEAVAKAHLVN
jgi:ribosome maturation factor RimP